MLRKTSQYKQQIPKINPSLEIAINNLVLNLILSRGWIDYDKFSSKLSGNIVAAAPFQEKDLINIIKSFRSHFFSLNNIKINDFIGIFPIKETINLLKKFVQIKPLTFIDIFPETNYVGINEGKKTIIKLASLPESIIQKALIDSLREKNATNCRDRAKDTVLEVADIEHFSLNVYGISNTFTAVVKGYKSVNSNTIKWKSIAHQIVRAYSRTTPDYILVIIAKNLADSVISELTQYSKSVGNENLVIIADPLTLARFLKTRNVI